MSTRLATVNAFGTLGYISLLLQWVWCLLVIGYPFISGDHSLLFPVDAPRVIARPTVADFGGFSPLVFVVASTVSLLVVVAAIITVARLPQAVGKKGAQATLTAARVIVPTLAHHKKISNTRTIHLTTQVVMGLKLLGIVAAPLALLTASPVPQLSTTIILAVGGFCAGLTIVWFTMQYVLARLLQITPDKIW